MRAERERGRGRKHVLGTGNAMDDVVVEGIDCAALDWIGLDWIGLGWAGLGWGKGEGRRERKERKGWQSWS